MSNDAIPSLDEGEIYVGRINDQHIILLPGDNDDATWQVQMDWAKSIGGDLPTRVEQAMLWAGFKDQFKDDWYWSNETSHRNSAWAWRQGFSNGYQSYYCEYNKFRARAVRRVKIGGTQ